MMPRKEYRVTCKGMYADGRLVTQGQTFWMAPDAAKALAIRKPHFKFEAVDEDSGKVVPARRKGGASEDARLDQPAQSDTKPEISGPRRVRGKQARRKD